MVILVGILCPATYAEGSLHYVLERSNDSPTRPLSEIILLFNKFKGYVGPVFTLYTFFIGILIFMENKNPSKTVAWLLILFLVPVLGFIIYLFLGQNVRKKTMFKKKKGRDFSYFEQIATIQKDAIKDKTLFQGDDERFVKKRLISLILNSAKAPFTTNNRSKVLTNGMETFESIMEVL